MQINPYAIYVKCDASMDYRSKSPAGIGVRIEFPDFVDLDPVEISSGRYENANIERLELSAILSGMDEVIALFKTHREKFRNVTSIIILTDRLGLIDDDKTSPFKIRSWKHDKWHNYEGKEIKNHDLLDKIDKTRNKLRRITSCSLRIEYIRRKYNRRADKLAKKAKTSPTISQRFALKGNKIGKRKYNGATIKYNLLEERNEYHIHVFKKEPIINQWQISVELCEGSFVGRKFDIYGDSVIERRLHRQNEYKIRIKSIFTHHVTIYKTIRKLKNKT